MDVKLENLVKKYGDKIAVDNLSVTFPKGKLTSILGPSGCGKTTTLNIIAGLEKQTEGYVYYDDKRMLNKPTEERNIGMIFQNYALYPHMTVKQNIEFPLQIAKIGRTERDTRVKEISDIVKIKDLLDRKPGELSGGEQQRVAIARAIVKKPKLLLMDEPFSNLDKKLRNSTRQEIRNIQESLSITTIFVTHDQEEAISISDKVLLMNNGKLVQFSDPINIYSEPTSLFSAKFIGESKINIYDAYLKNNRLNIDGIKNNISIDSNILDAEVIVVIRPENIRVNLDIEDIKVNIQGITPMGKEGLVCAKKNDKAIYFYLSNSEITELKGESNISIDYKKLLVFDKKTGKRIYVDTSD